MRYEAPRDEEGNPYYVPVVAKNQDFLMGYLRGLDTANDMIMDVLTSIDINVDLGKIDILLDSTRFNDLLENGKYESEMSDDEKKSYIFDIVEEVTYKLSEENSENNLFNNTPLKLECTCGLGFYSWANIDEIPETNFKCHNCGKILIHYTNKCDSNYEYHEGR